MQINRYTQGPVARYNPMSMNELAFAPSILRQRHDEAQESVGLLESEFGNYDVLDNYLGTAEELVNPLRQNAQQLAEDLATQGINRSQGTGRAMKLAAEYKNTFGPTGGIGQLQSATKSYRAQQQAINEFFKDSPELARYKSSQLRPGEASLVDGKLQIGESSTPNYVKDIPQAEILDRLDKAASSLKASDFGDYGIEGVKKLNGFTDLITLASGEGVNAQRANDLMNSLLSTEERASLAQRGELYGLTPEESINQFKNQLVGVANSRAYEKVNRSRIQLKDDAGIANLKNMSRLTTSPGPLISRDMDDVLKDNGLKFDDKGENIVEAKTTGQEFRGFLDKMSVGPFAGWKIINQGLDELGILIKNADLAVYASNPQLFASKIAERANSEYLKEEMVKANKENIKKDMTQSVAAFKDAYPEFAGVSNKDAYAAVSEARNAFSQLYSDVVAPEDADFTYINRQVLGGPNQTGDFERRQIFVGDQKIGTGDQFYKQLGYKNFQEFKENGQPSMETGVTFGGKSPAAFVMNAIDSDGNPVTATVQSNREFEAAGRIPNKMLSYIQEGKMFKELSSNESNLDFSIQPDPGNSIYYIFDMERALPVLVETQSGLTPREVRQKYIENPNDVELSFVDAVNNATMEIFYGESKSGNLLRK